MPVVNFDAIWQNRLALRECVLFGTTYSRMRDLPFDLGMRFTFLELEPNAEELFQEILDYCFGEGTYHDWVTGKRISAQQMGEVLKYVRSGYDPESAPQVEEEAPKNGEGGAEISETSSASTGQASAPTSSATTASDSSPSES